MGTVKNTLNGIRKTMDAFDHIMTGEELDEFMDDLSFEFGYEINPDLSYIEQADAFDNYARVVQDTKEAENLRKFAMVFRKANTAWFGVYN